MKNTNANIIIFTSIPVKSFWKYARHNPATVKNEVVEMHQTKNDENKYVAVYTVIGKEEKNIEVSFRYNLQS